MQVLPTTRRTPHVERTWSLVQMSLMGLWLCVFVLLNSGCSDETGPADSASDKILPQLVDENGCNPIASVGDCLLPYPSDVFLIDDATMPAGKRVNINGDAVMVTVAQKKIQPMKIYKADGFSRHAQIAVLFPEGVDDSNLVFHTGDVAASLGDDSPTVILEASTGERVAHFAELDPNADSDARRTLLIRPLVRLKEKTRYIVAVRNLKNKAGQMVSAPAGFQKIRDGVSTEDEILTLLAQVYEDEIFPALESAGILRGDSLQLAWDFTTGSEENTIRDMLTVQADAIKRFNETPPVVIVTNVTDSIDTQGTKLVQGTFKVPLYVESSNVGAQLNRDSDGKVVAVGETDVPFSAIIPPSVINRKIGVTAARAIQYGHGAFGSQWEVTDIKVTTAADYLEAVFFAVDWWGFSEPDQGHVANMMGTNPSDVFGVGDRLHQAMVNQIALTYAIEDTMTTAEELRVGGRLAYDPSTVYFYGVSGGGIMGATYTALAPKIERSVLGVGGVNFPLFMYRSTAFASFYGLLRMLLKDPVDIQKFPLVSQTAIDRFDPATYASHMISNLYPNSPPSRRVLLHIGIGDARVCTLSGELLARIAGLKLLEPAVRPVYGLESVQAPYDGSAMTVFDFNLDTEPAVKAEIPSGDNVVHSGIRMLPETKAQIDAFLRPGGMIEATCDGTCNPD